MIKAFLDFVQAQKIRPMGPPTTPEQLSFNSCAEEEEDKTPSTTLKKKSSHQNEPIVRREEVGAVKTRLWVRTLKENDDDPPYKYLLETHGGTWKVLNRDDNEGVIAAGKYCYVRKCGEHFIRVIEAGKSTHILLAECQDAVDFAGEVFFSNDGQLLWYDNFSGAFQPSPKLRHQVEFFPEKQFIDRSGSAVEKSSGPAENKSEEGNQATTPKF
jgi:hypothetical protein